MTIQTIGDYSLAVKIDNAFANHTGSYRRPHPRAPHGFRRVGDGAYRTAYLHKESQVVYKHGSTWANEKEAENAERLSSLSSAHLPFTLRIPQTRLMPNLEQKVIAQEFAANARPTKCNAYESRYNYLTGTYTKRPCNCGHSPCFMECFSYIMDWACIGDVHYYNVLIDAEGVLWLIDMGE